MRKKDLDKVDVLLLYFPEIINSMQVRSIKAHMSSWFEEKKPAGVTRVIIVGDSAVFGQGVEENETLAVQLEAMLNKKDQEKGSETETKIEIKNQKYISWSDHYSLSCY